MPRFESWWGRMLVFVRPTDVRGDAFRWPKNVERARDVYREAATGFFRRKSLVNIKIARKYRVERRS
jgi:hypothetical protein